MHLAQGHNAVMLLSLLPATPQSRVKQSTTEPLRSLFTCTGTSIKKVNAILYFILDYFKLACCLENSVDPDQLASSEAS